jgi:hypothetical protein
LSEHRHGKASQFFANREQEGKAVRKFNHSIPELEDMTDSLRALAEIT